MNKNIKIILTLLILFVVLLLVSEIVNYLSNPNSASSSDLNRYFIHKSIKLARNNDFNKSFNSLIVASTINSFGKFNPYRSLLPQDFKKNIDFPNNDNLKFVINKYLTNITDDKLQNPEDQGIGKIYYDIAMIVYQNGETEAAEQFFRKAMYNNPEFASFHAELINFYFTIGNIDKMNKEMDYCLKFSEAKTLCGQYRDDSLRLNIAKPVGYMGPEVEKHYLSHK